tara:strand:- start:61 stop:393 length:333 start_codon:yes stop_codon:yes gene_type:complete
MITKITILITTIALSLSTAVSAAPSWVQKPVQCASPQEVLDRLDADGLDLLLGATGNARVENNMYTKPYGFYYNQENNYWAFVEFFDNETMCIIVVGEGVEFDVTPKKEL